MPTRSKFAAGMAAAAAVFPARALAQSKPLAISYLPSAIEAPLFVAADRGYLAAEGFDATLVPIDAGQDAIALAATGRVDVVGGGLSAGYFNAVGRGLDVRYVASTAYQPKVGRPSALMVRQDLWDGGQVRTVADLRGRTVAWNGGLSSTATYYVVRLLRGAGLTIKDITVQNLALPDGAVALQRKAIDAVWSPSPTLEQLESAHLAHTLAFPPVGIATTGVFFGTALLQNRAAGSAVMRALRRAASEIAGPGYYRQENLDTLARYTRIPAATIASAPRYDIAADLHVDVATMLDMQRTFADLGLLAYHVPLAAAQLTATF